MKEAGLRPDAEAYSLAMTLCAMDKRVPAAIDHLKVCVCPVRYKQCLLSTSIIILMLLLSEHVYYYYYSVILMTA